MDKKSIYSKVKPYFTWGGIFLLTILLMVYFKFSDKGYLSLQSQGENLFAKYTEGLSPLYSKFELTNTDVFNFAVFDKIPIEKERNRYLILNNDAYGNDNIEIAELPESLSEDNYEKFVSKLNLTTQQNESLDSIIGSYKEDIYASIFLNSDQSVALDRKISLLHKALGADIYNFSNKVLNEKQDVAASVSSSEMDVDKFKSTYISSKPVDEKDFIFLTPDTAFTYSFVVDKNRIKDELSGLNKGSDPENKYVSFVDVLDKNRPVLFGLKPIENEDYIYKTDSNFKKLTIPNNYFSSKDFPEYKKLKSEMDKLSLELKALDFKIGPFEKGISFSVSALTDESKEQISVDLNLEKLGLFINNSISAALDASHFDSDEFSHKIDSLSKTLVALEKDSAAVLQLKQVSEELKKANLLMHEKKLEKLKKNKK